VADVSHLLVSLGLSLTDSKCHEGVELPCIGFHNLCEISFVFLFSLFSLLSYPRTKVHQRESVQIDVCTGWMFFLSPTQLLSL